MVGPATDETGRIALMQQEKTLKVSVCVITYNQDKYIRQCLQSIVDQKTNFSFEVIVGDDCSLDGTRAVVREFVDKYPNIVNPIFRDKNIGPINNFSDVLTVANGKYIAVCEGDDYWIDPLKLQKQVDFLEKNPNCSLCFHNAFIIDEIVANHVSCFNIPNDSDIFTTRDLFEKSWFVPTASIIFRTSALPEKYPEWFLNAHNGDLALLFLVSKQGTLGVIPGYLSVYRMNSINSLSRIVNKRPDFYLLKLIELIKSANLYFDHKYDKEVKRDCLRLYMSIVKIRIKKVVKAIMSTVTK